MESKVVVLTFDGSFGRPSTSWIISEAFSLCPDESILIKSGARSAAIHGRIPGLKTCSDGRVIGACADRHQDAEQADRES